MTTRIRTRFAPSPTGNLHIGGARTALFNYLWAQKTGGDFILRIEDTDKNREQPESWHSIYYGLQWLGIRWSEGLSNPDTKETTGPHASYIQSERTAIYAEYAQELIKKGLAYYCFCSAERLEKMRAEQQLKKMPPKYDRLCRGLSADEVQQKRNAKEKAVIRFAVPLSGKLVINDVLRGDITFDLADIDDQVLIKADGLPTYHLANVVDDHLMEITHVIRGEEWLPSTPKHVLLYQAFGWMPPQFVHLTVFLSEHGGKMSKRDGATSLFSFRDLGFLPEAIVNGIALLGWNPKTEEEIFSLEQLIERFDLSMINTANPVFSITKLEWINQQYMKKLSRQEVLYHLHLLEDSASAGYAERYSDYLNWFSQKTEQAQDTLWLNQSERASTFWQLVLAWEELMREPKLDPVKLVWKKSTPEKTKTVLTDLITCISAIADADFHAASLERIVRAWIEQGGYQNGDVLWPMRYALSGQEKSAPPFELAEVLEKTKTLERLQAALQQLN